MALSHLTCWQEKWNIKKIRLSADRNPAARSEASAGGGGGVGRVPPSLVAMNMQQ